MLLPPKSLRSRLGDSERFNPLQREGERFTAGDEGEGREKRQGGVGVEKGEGTRNRGGGGGRERGVLFTEVLQDFKAMVALGGRTRPSPLPSEPREMPSCPLMFIPLRGKHLGQELMAPLCSGSSCSQDSQGGAGPRVSLPYLVLVFGLSAVDGKGGSNTSDRK